MVHITPQGYNALFAKTNVALKSPVFPTLEAISEYADRYLARNYTEDFTFEHNGVTLKPDFLTVAKVQNGEIYLSLNVNLKSFAKAFYLLSVNCVAKLADSEVGNVIAMRIKNAIRENHGAIKEAMVLAFEADWDIRLEELAQTAKFNSSAATPITEGEIFDHVQEDLFCYDSPVKGHSVDYKGHLHQQGDYLFVTVTNHNTEVIQPTLLFSLSMLAQTDQDNLAETVGMRLETIMVENETSIIECIQAIEQENADYWQNESSYREHVKYGYL